MTSTIFSIGHGSKKIESFIKELKEFNIEYLFDVRSSPLSKFNPQFNRPLLERELIENKIGYEFLGKYLGGRPQDKNYYTDGKVDYSKLRERDLFQMGIELLIEVNNHKTNVAIMCSESNPGECHRSKLIGQELLKFDISVNHIVFNEIKDQKTVIDELTKGKGLDDLFGESGFTSTKTYL